MNGKLAAQLRDTAKDVANIRVTAKAQGLIFTENAQLVTALTSTFVR